MISLESINIDFESENMKIRGQILVTHTLQKYSNDNKVKRDGVESFYHPSLREIIKTVIRLDLKTITY